MPHFRQMVWAHYRKQGRHDLPWRKTSDPYRTLVSEVMLQQTQVHRVIPMYAEFMRRFPTVKKLAGAPLSEVLKAWQGLGYNRRAKMLHQSAGEIVARFRGRFPETVEELESLPGVGPYTARAVAAFSYNQDVVVIETNIRTAVIHHFFPKKKKVDDKEIGKILLQALPKGKAREWYSALMDYGASLKRSGISHNARSADHATQSKFAGSLREARGIILKRLALGSAPRATLANLFGTERRPQLFQALKTLCKEGLVQKKRDGYALAD